MCFTVVLYPHLKLWCVISHLLQLYCIWPISRIFFAQPSVGHIFCINDDYKINKKNEMRRYLIDKIAFINVSADRFHRKIDTFIMIGGVFDNSLGERHAWNWNTSLNKTLSKRDESRLCWVRALLILPGVCCVVPLKWCSNHCFSCSVRSVSTGLCFVYVEGVVERLRDPLKSWTLIPSNARTELLLSLKLLALNVYDQYESTINWKSFH